MTSAQSITHVLTTAIEVALNHYLRLDPAVLPRLEALDGKVIAIELKGLDGNLYLLPGARGIQVRKDYQGIFDTKLRGTPWALLRLGMKKQGSDASALFSGDVEISGDVELGQNFKRILDEIDIDWEELLSKVVGDVLAHQAGNATRQAHEWSVQALETFGQNFAEYQQEEARNLPGAHEMAEFLKAVDVVRDDVERLEQRIYRLKEKIVKMQGTGA